MCNGITCNVPQVLLDQSSSQDTRGKERCYRLGHASAERRHPLWGLHTFRDVILAFETGSFVDQDLGSGQIFTSAMARSLCALKLPPELHSSVARCQRARTHPTDRLFRLQNFCRPAEQKACPKSTCAHLFCTSMHTGHMHQPRGSGSAGGLPAAHHPLSPAVAPPSGYLVKTAPID